MTARSRGPVERRWADDKTVAKYIGVSPATVRNMAARGDIPAYRIGTRVRYDLNEIDKAAKRIPAAGQD